MKRLISILVFIADHLSYLGGVISGLAVLGMTLAVSYAAIMRYFNVPVIGVDELTGYAVVAVSFLALGYALKEGSHITADIIVSRLSNKAKRLLHVVSLFISLGLVIILIWSAKWLIQESWELNALSPTLYVPLYIPQLFILVGLGFFALQIVVELLRSSGLNR
jgi:TRAP-type C4-dicarboxylate transport system permease small subunit